MSARFDHIHLVRRIVVYLVVAILCSVIQVWPGFHFSFPMPDFLLMLPLVAGMTFGEKDGLYLGLATGFLREFLGSHMIGPGMLGGMFIGLIAGRLRAPGTKKNLLRFILLPLAVAIIHRPLMAALETVAPPGDRPAHNVFQALTHALTRVPYDMLGAMIAVAIIRLLFLLGFYKRKKTRERGRRQTVLGG